MRFVFFGTPELAVPALRALVGKGHDARLAVSQPDRAAGRVTTACVLGHVGAKLLIAAFLVVEAGLIAWHLDNKIIAAMMVAGAVWFVLDGLIIWRERPYSKRMMAAFLLGWNAIAVITAPWIWHTAAFIDTI